MIKLTCLNCGSEHVLIDKAFEFYRCEDCSTIWHDEDLAPDKWEPQVEDLTEEEIQSLIDQ